MQEQDQLAAESNDDTKMQKPTSMVKPLHKLISEHKDVTKIVIQLNSIVSTFKVDTAAVLAEFSIYEELWSEVRDSFILTVCPCSPMRCLCRLRSKRIRRKRGISIGLLLHRLHGCVRWSPI